MSVYTDQIDDENMRVVIKICRIYFHIFVRQFVTDVRVQNAITASKTI